MSEIAQVNTSASDYSSLVPKTAEDAAKFYNAVNNAQALKDAVNTPLKVVDVIIRPGEFADDQGVVQDRLVTTLVTDTGHAFASNSPTVADSVRNLMRIFGEPRTGLWADGVTVVPKLMPGSTKDRSFITLALPEGKK